MIHIYIYIYLFIYLFITASHNIFICTINTWCRPYADHVCIYVIKLFLKAFLTNNPQELVTVIYNMVQYNCVQYTQLYL